MHAVLRHAVRGREAGNAALDTDRLVAQIEVARYVDLGYKAIRVQCGIPGLPSTYGVSKDRMHYEPADAALPTENIWSTPKYLDHVPKLFDAVRSRFGFEHHILHDVHH